MIKNSNPKSFGSKLCMESYGDSYTDLYTCRRPLNLLLSPFRYQKPNLEDVFLNLCLGDDVDEEGRKKEKEENEKRRIAMQDLNGQKKGGGEGGEKSKNMQVRLIKDS
jgi:hypothetical protein